MSPRTLPVARIGLVAGVVAATLAVAAPATAVRADGSAAVARGDGSAAVVSWDDAAARLGTAGSLWEPMRTAGLARTRPIRVLGQAVTVEGGAVTGGATYAGTRYGRGDRMITVHEKWAETRWSIEPDVTRGLVDVVRIPIGRRGSRSVVVARVYADCERDTTSGRPRARLPRCQRSDVLRTGGALELTTRPSAATNAPGRTTIVITSKGLTYARLLSVARSLQQVAGSPALGAGSAQMVGMCRQMIDARMDPATASAFVASNGYTLRIASIDGQGQPMTADVRPDRFSVDVVANAVIGCAYG